MKPRRQLRAAQTGFSLALPSDLSRGEVQVQQKNEQEVNKFFIDADDTMVSPIISTTTPAFASTALPTVSEAASAATAKVTSPAPAGLSAQANGHADPSTAAHLPDGKKSPLPKSPAPAKFIHVNNTNLFVLMDGISMFFDDKSTFSGTEDPFLLQLARSRKASGSTKAVNPPPGAAHARSPPVSRVATGVDGGKREGTCKAEAVDTVEAAIRGIELNDATDPLHTDPTCEVGLQLPCAVPSTVAFSDDGARRERCVPSFSSSFPPPPSPAVKAPAPAGRTADPAGTANGSTSLSSSFSVPGRSAAVPAVSGTASSLSQSSQPSVSAVPSVTSVASGSGASQTVAPAAPPSATTAVPSRFAALFSQAKRPNSTAIFGRHTAASMATSTAPLPQTPASSNPSFSAPTPPVPPPQAAAAAGPAAAPSTLPGKVVTSTHTTPSFAPRTAGNQNDATKQQQQQPTAAATSSFASTPPLPTNTATSAAGATNTSFTATGETSPSLGASEKTQKETARLGVYRPEAFPALPPAASFSKPSAMSCSAQAEPMLPKGSPSTTVPSGTSSVRDPDTNGGSPKREMGRNFSSVSLASLTKGQCETPSKGRRGGHGPGGGHGGRQKPFSAEDVGHSNRSLLLEEVEVLNYIGSGAQGSVYRVMLEGKLYALKQVNITEATQATNAVERQGRKRGLVKELNMIKKQRDRPPPQHLMQMFNAVVTLQEQHQELSLLIELMSFGGEDAQKMVARMPQAELMKITQSTFRNHMSGNNSVVQGEVQQLMKQQHGSCMHVLGRNTFNVPEEWERGIERQSQMPEIVLSMLAADVLRGLKELHMDYGLVHCDLKPANVLLCFDKQRFKLADFGCACSMDADTRLVKRTGVDLGSKLYKAPERLRNELTSDPVGAIDAANGAEDEVVFSDKSDVWSLGILLLELGSGVHPCEPFKSDFWNYTAQLKLSKMIKPLSWSPSFCDFVVRCTYADEEKRWPVAKLLQHPFIVKYDGVPRSKLKTFMERLEAESATFQRKQQRELILKQIQASTSRLAKNLYQTESRTRWKTFTGFLSVAPELNDPTKFPQLQ